MQVDALSACISFTLLHSTLHSQATKNPVGTSYAKALVDLANEKGKLEPIHADMDAVSQLMNSNKALADLVTNPIVDKDKKRNVLQKIGKEAGACVSV